MNQAKRPIDEIEPEATPVEEQSSLVWTPEMVKDVEAFIENLADRYLQFKKDEEGADQNKLSSSIAPPHEFMVKSLMINRRSNLAL